MPFEGNTQEDTEPSNWALTRRLLGLAWKYRLGCIKVLSLQVILLTLGLLGLGLTGLGVDCVRYHMALSSASSRLAAKPPIWPFGLEPPETWTPMLVLGFIALCILVFAALRSLLNVSYTIGINKLVQGQIVVDLRASVFRKMQRLSFRFFDANASGAIINRVTGDVQAVRRFVDGVVIQSIILLISLSIYLVYMLNINMQLTVACLATVPLLWIATVRFSRLVRPAYVRNRSLFDDQILALSENVQGVHVVKGFARQEEEITKFDRALQAVRSQKNWIFDKVSRFQPYVGFLTHINLVVLLIYGGWLVVRYERAPDPETAALVGISVGQLLVFAGLLQQFSGQIANLSVVTDSMQQSLTGSQRVFEVIDAPVEIRTRMDAVSLPRLRGDVTFDRTSFSYRPPDMTLEDISFDVKAGQCVAVLGPTGAGKTALLSLIPRFYDTTSGRVLVDGYDVREIDLEDLRRGIGMVFQESFLFSNTVRNNISFGCPGATEEQVVRAAKIAAAHDFIMAMPKGYDTILREGGSNLSGGQRQRLALARALLLEPSILLLDDPTAAVDPQTETEIMAAMDNAMKGRTTFVIAHRLSTLRRANLVVVLRQGKLVQIGTHEELMKTRGFYRYAARLQGADQESLDLLARMETAK